MPRLSGTPGVLGAAIAAAVALWWMPGAWLQGPSGFADLPGLSAHAAVYVMLAQAVLVPLFAARWFGEGDGSSMRVALVEVVAAMMPAWPLLVLLWLTSELSAHALVASQLLITFLAVLLAWLGGALVRSAVSECSADVLRGAAGLVPAAVAWSLRGDLHAWVMS